MKAANTPVAPPPAPEISCPPLGEFIYCGGGSATYQVVLDWQPSSDPSVIRDYLVVLEDKDTSANWQFTVGDTQVDVATTVKCSNVKNYRSQVQARDIAGNWGSFSQWSDFGMTGVR